MPLSDLRGRRWAHSSSIKVGDLLECDKGFTCLRGGDVREVKCEGDRLYIECWEGKHFLDGQIGDDGELVGLYEVLKSR